VKPSTSNWSFIIIQAILSKREPSFFMLKESNRRNVTENEHSAPRAKRVLRRGSVLFLERRLYCFANNMPDQNLPPTIFHMLEKNVGKQIRVILDPAYGFEGTLMAVTREPAGIWLSDAEAVILRATIAQPIPQVTSREERSEIFVHLNSVQRIEILHPPSRH
jgi:hypothetical protein